MADAGKTRLREMASGAPPPPPSEPSPTIPSASILLISPTNQILLLHRVVTSSAFPSAHVFPGGHIDPQDGRLPPLTDPTVHEDSEAYRCGAIRECFEESGILLARPCGAAGGSLTREMLNVSAEERQAGREAVHASRSGFCEWVREKGGVLDLGGLIPFTRWLTPKSVKRRYTTQMYLYFLPLFDLPRPHLKNQSAQIPTSDGGIEHTEAVFDYAEEWLRRSRAREIVLFPPQVYLLTLIAHHLKPLEPSHRELDASDQRIALDEQRVRLMEMIQDEEEDPSWGKKCISPRPLHRDDKMVTMALDYAGDEVQEANRRGDLTRVMMWGLEKSGPADVELRKRSEVEQKNKSRAGRYQEKL